jgi:RNA polymerase sigma-70 factor, ECF subfamily
VGTQPESSGAERVADIYQRALPQVYGYLLPRCGSTVVAEDLTADTFMAAVAALAEGRIRAADVTVAWLIGVARHKLADHWRRSAREQRGVAAVAVLAEEAGDPWDKHLDVQAAHAALARLPGPQRAALTLRYLDGLPVAEVAACLGRSLHATETLLVRGRAALRRIYREEGSGA